MTDRTTILNELNELGSSLANLALQNTYHVPEGYFDRLAIEVLVRIKAAEADSAKEELEIISPFLSRVSREMPYSVPAGYFENLSENINVHQSQSASDELSSISPLVGSISKKLPYSVPDGYFENIGAGIVNMTEKQSAKVIPIKGRRILKYAVAAMITGILTVASLILMVNNQIDPNKNPQVWLNKKVEKKVDAAQLDEIVALASGDDASNDAGIASTNTTDEIKELMKDVPEEEIQSFLKEAAGNSGTDDTDVLLN